VRVAHPETFTEDVAKLLRLTVKQGKLREKKYGENLSARFRRSKLLGGPLQPVKVRVMEGILLVDSHLSDLLDVEFSYRAGSEELVLTAVQQLLSGGDGFVVAEPDLKLRLLALAGKPYPRVSGDAGRLKAMRQYLYWQVLIINWFWHLLYQDPANKLLVRQLRVKIRRLRSCLVFFKEGLTEEPVSEWQAFFREEADVLSNMRELDAAALTCRRRHEAAGEEGAGLAMGQRGGLLFRSLRGLCSDRSRRCRGGDPGAPAGLHPLPGGGAAAAPQHRDHGAF